MCFETMVMWTEILYNLSFERLASVTSVISLYICTNMKMYIFHVKISPKWKKVNAVVEININ